jgi:hypothetical protein
MADSRRLELTLRKPRLGWFPRPTVIFNGRGQPAQWGTGTWQLSDDEPNELTIFLYNRVWRWGHATITVAPGDDAALVYSPPMFFVGRGRLASASL